MFFIADNDQLWHAAREDVVVVGAVKKGTEIYQGGYFKPTYETIPIKAYLFKISRWKPYNFFFTKIVIGTCRAKPFKSSQWKP